MKPATEPVTEPTHARPGASPHDSRGRRGPRGHRGHQGAADGAPGRAARAADQGGRRLRGDVRRLLLLRQADLQRPGVAVRLGGRARRIRSSSTRRCSNISSCSSSSRCSARPSCRFRWSPRRSTCSWRPASTATRRRPSCLIWSRRRSSSRSASLVVYFLVMPMLVRFSLGMQQIGGDGRAAIELLPKVGRLSLADDGADLRLRRRLPAAGDADVARPRRHHHVASSSSRSGAISSSAPSWSRPC